MSDCRKLILTPFTGRKENEKYNIIKEKYIPIKKDKIQLKETRDHIRIKEMVSRIIRR